MNGRLSYVILIGDIGGGKSTVVEKVTGIPEMTLAGSGLCGTKTSDVIVSVDGSLIICDTPGENVIGDALSSSLKIVRALNFMPVNLLLVIVKADIRIERVVKQISSYPQRFEDFPKELIGYCITHMDTVSWTEDLLIHCLKSDFGIEKVIFNFSKKESRTIIQEINDQCLKNEPVSISIDSEIFLKLFTIHKRDIKILRRTRTHVGRFKKFEQDFCRHLEKYTDIEQRNMIFEFQTWMYDQILETQKEFSRKNNFSYSGGPELVNEVGHIASLTNELRQILRNVRTEAMKHHADVVTDFRKCPYCGEICQKVEDFREDNQCGNSQRSNCSRMAPAKGPSNFCIANYACTKDVNLIPQEHRDTWKNHYDQTLRQKPKLQIRKVTGF